MVVRQVRRTSTLALWSIEALDSFSVKPAVRVAEDTVKLFQLLQPAVDVDISLPPPPTYSLRCLIIESIGCAAPGSARAGAAGVTRMSSSCRSVDRLVDRVHLRNRHQVQSATGADSGARARSNAVVGVLEDFLRARRRRTRCASSASSKCDGGANAPAGM